MHLNSILVNIKNSDQPNAPRYIRHKRRKSFYIEKETNVLSSSASNSDFLSDSDQEQPSKPDLKFKINFDDPILNASNQASSVAEHETANHEVESVSQSSNLTNTSELLDKKTTNVEPEIPIVDSLESKIPTFQAHIPSLGGYFYKRNGQKIVVTNTCTIDNYLFALWVLSKLIQNFNFNLPNLDHTSTLNEVVHNIDIYNWNNARQLWYTNIMKKNIRNKRELSFFGTVEDFFLKYMYIYQKHDLIQKCSKNCINNGNIIISEQSDILHFGKIKNKGVEIVTDMLYKCVRCNFRVTCYVRFRNNPIFLFIETNSHFKIHELPKIFEIENKRYKLLCVILHREEIKHFVSVFEIENNLYLVDNMTTNKARLLSSESNENGINYFQLNISSALYYLL